MSRLREDDGAWRTHTPHPRRPPASEGDRARPEKNMKEGGIREGYHKFSSWRSRGDRCPSVDSFRSRSLAKASRGSRGHGSVFTTTGDDLRPELEEAARKSVEERSAVLLARVNSVHHGWKVAAWFGLPPRADLLKAARELRGLGKSSKPSHWPGISEKVYRQRIELYEEVTEGRIKRIQRAHSHFYSGREPARSR